MLKYFYDGLYHILLYGYIYSEVWYWNQILISDSLWMIFALYIKVLYTDKIENPTQQGKMLSWRCSQAYKIFKSLEKSKREDKHGGETPT